MSWQVDIGLKLRLGIGSAQGREERICCYPIPPQEEEAVVLLINTKENGGSISMKV